MSEYWEIALEEILSEAGLDVTNEQLKEIADSVNDCATASGEYSSPAQAASVESSKAQNLSGNTRVCGVCHGVGSITDDFGSYTSRSQCYECCGEGFKSV